MSAKALIQAAIHGRELPSNSIDDVSANSSAILGVTLLGDPEDALAALRTAVLLAKNLRATLSVDLSGRDIFSIDFGEAPRSKLATGFLDSVRAELRRLISICGPDLILEVTITSA